MDYVLDVFKQVDKIFWNEKGYYDFRKNAGIIYSTPMHRWATGPIFLALSYLFNEIELK